MKKKLLLHALEIIGVGWESANNVNFPADDKNFFDF
jgi:hypothetical protein